VNDENPSESWTCGAALRAKDIDSRTFPTLTLKESIMMGLKRRAFSATLVTVPRFADLHHVAWLALQLQNEGEHTCACERDVRRASAGPK